MAVRSMREGESMDRLISEQQVLEAVDKVCCGSIEYRVIYDRCEEQIKAIPSAEPCEDAISRQAVLSMQYRIDDSATLSTRDVVNVDDIEDLPSVTPQPETGHWIIGRIFPTKITDENLIEYRCSECDRAIRCTESQLVNYPYCHCGAKMVESQESEKV